MATIGNRAPHEQYPPSRLLQDLARAEAAGLAAASFRPHEAFVDDFGAEVLPELAG